MKLDRIHQSAADIQAENSDRTLFAIENQTRELGKLVPLPPDNSVHIQGYAALLAAFQTLNTKLDEVKSAILANTIILKRVEKKEFPAFPEIPKVPPFPKIPDYPKFPTIPKTDLTETNNLLKTLTEELRKPLKVTLKL